MPKVKRPGNQHNSRHENGIVAPGKRITKQKSNGHLNGSADASPQTHSASLPPSSSTLVATAIEHRADGNSTSAGPLPQTSELPALDGNAEDGTNVEHGHDGAHTSKGGLEQGQRASDGKNIRNPAAPGNGILNLALTILRACPIGDTIAILLVLLWLPPTLLTITNALFAVLTFMPPTLALPSFPPTLNDIFMGSGNTPSLATIFITDIIGLILWLVIWSPIQDLAIELAQAVVATTLGGGGASKRRGSEVTLLCMMLVTTNHVTRHDWFPRRIFGFDWPAILSSIPFLSQKVAICVSDDEQCNSTRSPAGWIRVVVALHILIQGLVHVLRRWYQKREYAQAAQISKKTDVETDAHAQLRRSSVSQHEGVGQSHSASTVDGTGRAVAPKEARDKALTGKKKRKQGTVVRSQQPLWAAFAATKLTVLREYEQSQAFKEVAEAKALDQRNLGSVPFTRETDRVWISKLNPQSFEFSTTLIPCGACPAHSLSEGDPETNAHHSESLQVRINDTNWTSVRVSRGQDDSHGKEKWHGEVFGLTPSSSYRCDFIQGKGGVTLYSLTVTTPPLLPPEGDPTPTSSDASQKPYQPSSPTSPKTTLKRTIAAFEASLSETQARQKKTRKDNKNAIASLKKDIDVLNSKINKLAGEDKAHLNRQMQWNQHTRQADEAVAAIIDEIESMGVLPEDDLKLSQTMKATWDEVKSAHAAVRAETLQAKEAVAREKSSVLADAGASQQKRERLVTRKTKLADQLERLETETAHGLDVKERKNSEQAAKELERAQYEQRSNADIANFLRAYQESRLYVQQAWQQIQALENAFQEQHLLNNMPSATPAPERPLTPEGDLPGTNPQNTQSVAFRFPAFGSPDTTGVGLRSHSGSLRHNGTRPRSTSGLSGNSVYADFEDQDPAPPMPARAVKAIREKGRQYSGGSGSASSGSQRDPASPLVSSAAQASPVGKRSPVWNS